MADLVAKLRAADRVVIGTVCNDEMMDTRRVVTGQSPLSAEAADLIEFMAGQLLGAGDRFADLADFLVDDGHPKWVAFMRASAERYRKAALGENDNDRVHAALSAVERLRGRD